MPKLVLTLALAALFAWGQEAARQAEFRHLYTYGSRQGIHPPLVLNRKPLKGALGESGHPYGLVYPVAVTTDLQSRVWITDSGTASVHVFDPATGAYREIRRLAGMPLQRPSGIASDGQGRVYLTDELTGGVYVFDEHGEFDHSLIHGGARPLESPTAIALSADNKTIYVGDPPRNAILELNREGEVNGTIALPPELRGLSSIIVIDNQLFVMSAPSHKIGIFSPGGRQRGELRWDEIALPTAFGFDPARRRFLAANPRWMVVQIFDDDGRNLGAFGQLGDGVDQMQSVDYLHVDRKGLIYVVDSRHGKVLVFGESIEKARSMWLK